MPFVLEEKEDEEFRGLDVSNLSTLADAYQDCTFIQCNFQSADLEKIRFSGCSFTDCNLSMSQVRAAAFNDCVFKNCKMLAVDWTSASSMRSPIFENCIMDANGFSEMQLSYCKFTGSRLHDARFHGSKLRGALFSGCDLQGAEFLQCDLREADFRQAKGYQISPIDNQVARAKFSFPEAMALLEAFDIVLQ